MIMRLVSCHIENFGKLHDYTVDFTEGANIICEENGWGKSTFAAFLRAMFYGLEGERKRSIEENERKRYTPWQGGVFGGQLTFETKGKQYTVTRTFNEQEEFEIRDAKTNIISTDYSSKLGEELFKVNRESFMRTVFIGQADCETFATDDVNAKIGNLAENTNDLNSFETANARLKEILNSLTPSRKTGSISQRKNEITELERNVSAKKDIPNNLKNVQSRRGEEVKKYNQLKDEVESVTKELRRVSALQEVIAKKGQWENLKQELQNTRSKFSDKVPQMREVEEAQLGLSTMEKAAERVATYELTDGEKEQLASLQMMFEKGVPDENAIAEKLSYAQQLTSLRTELLNEQVKLAQQKAEYEKKKQEMKKMPVLLIAGLVAWLLGTVLAAFVSAGIGMAVGLIGAILAIIGLVNKKKVKQEVLSQEPKEENCVRLEKEAEQMLQSVCDFLEKYGIYAKEDVFKDCLHELKAKATKYEYLTDKKQKMLTAKADYEHSHNAIYDFLMQYGFEPAHNLQMQLMKLRDDVQSHTDAYKKLEVFEEGADLSALLAVTKSEETLSLQELNEKLSALTEAREQCHERIGGLNADLESLQVQYEEWEENKLHLERLKDLQEQELQKYNHILKVQEYLTKAKESMTNRYAAPILESFRKYYEMITTDDTEKFHIDANTKITVDEQGKQREINTLSSGYRDLMGICLRVALVDAMYKDESPVLIMDDPFTNLDDRKMEKAKRFLKLVSEKYQVIYFTCSETRK